VTSTLLIDMVDRIAYKQGKKEKPPFVKSDSPERVTDDDDKKVPGELLCLICNNLLTDAVVIPCCGNSYCDDCKQQLISRCIEEFLMCGCCGQRLLWSRHSLSCTIVSHSDQDGTENWAS